MNSFFEIKPTRCKEEGLFLIEIASLGNPGLCSSYIVLVELGQKLLVLPLVARDFYSRDMFDTFTLFLTKLLLIVLNYCYEILLSFVLMQRVSEGKGLCLDLKTLFHDINITSLWRFSMKFHGLSRLLIKGFVKLHPHFWFQLMVDERDNLFLFSKATLQITPFGLPTSASDDIIIGSLWGTVCVPFTGRLMLQDLRHHAFKNRVYCFLVCGYISFLQANAISKTSSCQGATCFDPLRMGLGQLICDILFLIGANCNNLYV